MFFSDARILLQIRAAIASGAGTVAATRGKVAVLPVETRIAFRLSSPISLTEQK
jgi:hypothetical protein